MKFIFLSLIVFTIAASVGATQKQEIPADIHLRIIQLEDERNLNGDELTGLLKHRNPAVRSRAALAIGRIGDKRGTAPLVAMLQKDADAPSRAMAAFALGEIEDAGAANALLEVVNSSNGTLVESLSAQARAAEALGKIASAQGNAEKLGQSTLDAINQSLIRILPAAEVALAADQKLLSSLAITALMRLRNPASVRPLAGQLKSKDAEIRAQAANALARLRQPIEPAVPALIDALNDADADVRANAARALGASKDARAVEPLIKLLGDKSDRVQVNAVRALGALNDRRAVEPLVAALGEKLRAPGAVFSRAPRETNPAFGLMLELVTALGAIKDERALPFLRRARAIEEPEVEVALARFGEKAFFADLRETLPQEAEPDWRRVAAFAQGLGETGTPRAREAILKLLDPEYLDRFPAQALPYILRAAAKLKVEKLSSILRERLSHPDVIVRSTAASLLADLPEDKNLPALMDALERAKGDQANDAKLAILTAISKHTKPEAPKAMEAIKSALSDQDHLVRRHAVDLLKQTGAGDFSDRIGVVQTGHDKSFYQRVAGRLNKKVTARIRTSKGLITIELFPQDAPITVDSFITLALRDFFSGVPFHRVVPNFVIQGGDPRGDGEGGPGYQIRCEINTRPYTRGAVGMALSGKDTGGSQFFITHSPQPHLDGGYTVFGQVVDGMNAVDGVSRGAVIYEVEISESK
ncbi:MAG TPA: HEAT repeat domain-containing protein [Blastocatellia bacterium]|nr:HEAT repeat domain-containing protein [Blastocatellia bacterium]